VATPEDAAGSAEPDPVDPWAEIELDDNFIRGAKRSEASADERVAKAQRVNAEHAALEKQGTISPYFTTRKRSFMWFRRRASWLVPVLILGALVLGLYLAPQIGRWFGAQLHPPGWPQPGTGEQTARIHPAVAAADSTSYSFQHTQINTSEPVTYDPCRVIHYVINPKDEPRGGDQLIRSSFVVLQHATGLQFTYEGTTNEPYSHNRESYQPKRYGDRWAPVLVAWDTPSQDHMLSGDVIGDSGSAWVSLGDGSRYYVTGTVSLDAPQIEALQRQPGGAGIVRAVVLHELGHLAGLGHVNDPTQLMYPHATGAVLTYRAGDLAGLARLGAGLCSTSF